MNAFEKDILRFAYYARDAMDVLARWLAAAMLSFPLWSGSKAIYNSFAAGGLSGHQTFTNVVVGAVCLFGWGVVVYICLVWFSTTLDRRRRVGRHIVFIGPFPVWSKGFTLDEAAFVSSESLSQIEDSTTRLPKLTRSYSVVVSLRGKALLVKACTSSSQSNALAERLREWASN